MHCVVIELQIRNQNFWRYHEVGRPEDELLQLLRGPGMLFWGGEGGGSTLFETEGQVWRVRLQHLNVKVNLS